MPDTTLGMNASCEACGGDNHRTGNDTPRTVEPAFGSGPATHVRDVEFKCSQCGRLTIIREPVKE